MKKFVSSDAGIILIVSFLILFGPLIAVWVSTWIMEHLVLLDCHTNSGGALPFPTTPCGDVMFIILGIYYIWFVAPVPLVIPGLAIFFISKHFIQKSRLKNSVYT